ncbi:MULTISPECIES: ABC transporter permease [unclassified Vibrio]|uniref:Transport permease protein n=1 Tax=Vibrio sp. HB236076 TaxID=3232307 RepID=A0AB39HDN5_9VIBR|nr:ABC transporter permease [Vibrio sp. HB161653]MDP5254357.1 ABC transporter permease [Vibrio sp. HB161653]
MADVKKRSTLKVWGDVIFAIFLREIKSKFNDKFGIAWSVFSPVAFIFMLSYIRGRMDGGDTHGIPTFMFMVIGMIMVQFFLGVLGSASGAFQKNKPLYAFRQVQPISSVIAIVFFELLVKIAVILVIAIIIYYLRMDLHVDDYLEVILNLIRVWLFASSLGLIVSIAVCYVPEVKKIMGLATRPLFFISGIFFSLQDIPQQYWPYLTWNPLLHAVELTRYAAYPQYGDAGVSYFFLDACTILLLFFALAIYHVSWKQAISR